MPAGGYEDHPRIAVFASGRGSTFEALVTAASNGRLPAEIALLVASRAGVAAIDLASRLGIEAVVLDEKIIGPQRCDKATLALLQDRNIALVVLAGYLRRIGPETLDAFAGRILNTHPAPLPRFGGKGMFGDHVHQAVLDAKAGHSAATVHLVDGGYDTGPVIGETAVPVLPGDDVASLRSRVQAAERELLVSTIRDYARRL